MPPKEKLADVERYISAYGKDDKLKWTLQINLDSELLTSIVTPEEEDPLLYGIYELTGEQVEKLRIHSGYPSELDENPGDFIFLECFGIYN